MAIVFISPQRNHTTIFWSFIIGLVLLLLIASLITFLPLLFGSGKNSAAPSSANAPQAIINLDILHSDKVKSLQSFADLETEFAYTVQDTQGKQTSGTISAASQDLAQGELLQSGFKVISLQPVAAGRSNPFISY